MAMQLFIAVSAPNLSQVPRAISCHLFAPALSAPQVCLPSVGLAAMASPYIQRALGAPGPVLTGVCDRIKAGETEAQRV